MRIDVEREFEAAIPAIGGVHVRTLVGPSPPFENADFVFREAAVIAELKCLDEDKILDERVIEEASKLYLKELQHGTAPVVALGQVSLTTGGFSEDFTKKIISLYQKPIERLVKKANRQIRETASKLGLEGFKGLLVVANNNHSALDPWHGWFVLNKLLNQQVYSNINGAIYLSANQEVTVPGSERSFDVWAEIRRPHIPPVQSPFLSNLRQLWYRHLSKVKQQPSYSEVPIDVEQLAQLENKRET